ncbi:MAG: type II toxin-antitoxin system VapC family toxin [Lentisphaerales bacterium]|jgi:predicted nucleic acid-binding protein|nr:MAG: type II toxin-antitoxin system VapC family toxin [Lentisphaerales bacterium]
MLFDTDIFIWTQRGNIKAARLIEKEDERLLSVQSYMELMQCAQDKKQHDCTKSFLKDFGFRVIPLSENIGHRAAIYIEEYSLSHGLRVGDAIVGATATEHNIMLCSSNAKHFNPIKELKLKSFKP